jgi:hypothetical protein
VPAITSTTLLGGGEIGNAQTRRVTHKLISLVNQASYISKISQPVEHFNINPSHGQNHI